MRIVVCDDKVEDRNRLCSHIRQFFTKNNCTAEIAVYEDGGDFLADKDALESGSIKIAFLDIYMPGSNGIDVARKIRETDKDMALIFTTISRDHGLEGWSVDAFQYLLKPVKYEDVEKVLGKCIKLFADSLRSVEITSDRTTIRVLLKDITYVEVFRHDCLIHTTSKTIKSRRSLDDIEQELGDDSFIRTHRSYIVNMRYIVDITGDSFQLSTGANVPISRRSKQAVKQAYEDYVFSLTRRV